MFTGLIEDLGSVQSVERDAEGATVRVATRLATQLGEGDSIAVNGVCLTATDVGDDVFGAQAMIETLRRTSLADLRAGSKVNLELALPADGRLGGHIVQGHVDATATISGVEAEGFSRVLELDAGPELMRYLIEKGSVALDGVSLTVSGLRDGGFSVSLIPETLRRTNLGGAQVGDRVNVEVDILAKHVERLMGAHGGAGRRPTDRRSKGSPIVQLAYSVRHARCVLAQLGLRVHQRAKDPKEAHV